MLLEKLDFNKEEFYKLFGKKFSNYIEKCPMFIQYQIINDKILIFDYSKEYKKEPFIYDLNFSISVKENIKLIKDYLIKNNYPTFKVYNYSTYHLSTFEIQQKMEKEHLTFKEASSITKKEKTETLYRIEKIINKDNRLVIRNLALDEPPSLYQLGIPVILFLQSVFSNPEDIGDTFIKKSVFIKQLTDVNTA